MTGKRTPPGTPAVDDLGAVTRMLARERLAIDDTQPGRTCFLSHLGAQPRLLPGPWVGHRDVIYGLALANISPAQRTSLARAVPVEHDREFGVGRLVLEAVRSGLPMGGSSLRLRHRTGGPECLYTWALAADARAVPCDWLLLRAQPGWCADEQPTVLRRDSLEVLAELGSEVLVLVETATDAVEIAMACHPHLRVAAHPRFAPHIEGHDPEAPVLLWPHDALDGAGLRRRALAAAVLVDAPAAVRVQTEAWLARREGGERIEVVDVTCPRRVGRDALAKFWRACNQPRVLLRGDAEWVASGTRWLQQLGATVEAQPDALQLALL